jgi:protein TonB
MLSLRQTLWPALGLSLLLHGLPFASAWWPSAPEPNHPPATLQARLTAPAAVLPLSLVEPEASPPASVTPPKPPAQRPPAPPAVSPGKKPAPPAVDRKTTAKTWSEHIRQQFSQQQAQGLFYPEAARRQGIEGEVLVLLLVDAAGAVAAARVEESSGHPLLDEAALRAVRQLRSLPADTPREMLLPVSFRLR